LSLVPAVSSETLLAERVEPRVAASQYRLMEPLPEHTEADGLTIRRGSPSVSDASVIHDLIGRNVEHLHPRMAWIRDEPLELADRLQLLRRWDQEWLDGGDAYYAITSSTDGSAVGSCGLHRRIGPDGLEIGYWVDSGHLRQGIATRATRALMDLAFAIDGINVVEIPHDRENTASRGVPEGLGFELIGDRPATRDLAPTDTGIDTLWRMRRDQWH
jgi:ribosomal-protein-serine acetyltransferase